MHDFFAKATGAVSHLLRKVSGNNNYTTAIIVAAGSGTRMGNKAVTKQMMLLDRLPVIVHTLKQFEACPQIQEIVVVSRADEIEKYHLFAEQYNITKITSIVAGGETRQQSVLCGLEAVSEETSYVAIHDGARCLITPELITKVLQEAQRYGSALAANRVKETVKVVDASGIITNTPDRETLWCAQTPQIFRLNIYRAAAYSCLESGFTGTDDCMLVEHIGFPVKIVDCGYENIKITTPEDLFLAESILQQRKLNSERTTV